MKRNDENFTDEQKDFLAGYSCHILDNCNHLKEDFEKHGIPKKYLKKMNEALDIIFEVNQACFPRSTDFCNSI